MHQHVGTGKKFIQRSQPGGIAQVQRHTPLAAIQHAVQHRVTFGIRAWAHDLQHLGSGFRQVKRSRTSGKPGGKVDHSQAGQDVLAAGVRLRTLVLCIAHRCLRIMSWAIPLVPAGAVPWSYSGWIPAARMIRPQSVLCRAWNFASSAGESKNSKVPQV